MSQNEEDIDWSKGTWEEARREELRRWRQLSLEEKLQAVDDLRELGNQFIAQRKEKGLPYIDPHTGHGVNPKSVAEPK